MLGATGKQLYDERPRAAERFKKAARELGCDESEERFVETVRRREDPAAAQDGEGGPKRVPRRKRKA